MSHAVNIEYLTSYLIVDAFCLVMTFIIFYTMRNDSGSETQVRYFRRLNLAYLAFVVLDVGWAIVMIGGIGAENHALPAAFDGLTKVAVTFAAYYWFCYGEARFESPFVYNRRMRLLAAIPVMLVAPLYFLGYVLDLNVVFLGNGVVENGPMYIAVTCIALLYLVAATIHSVVMYRRADTTSERRTCLVFISFMVAPVVGAVFDAIVSGTPIMAPAMLVSILLVLLSLQESRISGDVLTGLNNRRRADAFLEECLAHVDDEHPVFLFIIDMDRFKGINDTYGHLEGDHALCLMATALRKACAELDAFAARWGGDEFVMICAHDIGDDAAHVVETIKARLVDEVRANGLEYQLACSVGYARCVSPGEHPDRLVAEADRMLYAAKG